MMDAPAPQPAAADRPVPFSGLTPDDLRFLREWQPQRERGVWPFIFFNTLRLLPAITLFWWLAQNAQRHRWYVAEWQLWPDGTLFWVVIYAFTVLLQQRSKFRENENRFRALCSVLPPGQDIPPEDPRPAHPKILSS